MDFGSMSGGGGSANIVSSILGIAGGGIMLAAGISKSKQAKSNAKHDIRPEYSTPKYEKENLNYLESTAGYGLSDTTKSLYSQGAERGLTASVDAILKAGGDPNTISNVNQNYLDSMSRMALLDERAKLDKINAVIGQRQRMSVYADKEWQLNKLYPWMDRQQRYAQDLAEGNKLTYMGISQLSNSVGQLGGAGGADFGGTGSGNAGDSSSGNSNYSFDQPNTNIDLGEMKSNYNGGSGVGLSYKSKYL